MYVKIYHRVSTQWGSSWQSGMLTEMTKRQLARAKREYPERLYLVVSGAEAHKWVRAGHIHSTPLYIDADKRIRYARDAS